MIAWSLRSRKNVTSDFSLRKHQTIDAFVANPSSNRPRAANDRTLATFTAGTLRAAKPVQRGSNPLNRYEYLPRPVFGRLHDGRQLERAAQGSHFFEGDQRMTRATLVKASDPHRPPALQR